VPAGQAQMFAVYRYHAVFTDSPEPMLDALLHLRTDWPWHPPSTNCSPAPYTIPSRPQPDHPRRRRPTGDHSGQPDRPADPAHPNLPTIHKQINYLSPHAARWIQADDSAINVLICRE
jgi:hypothetical protein